jgi:adenine C2-methylase RlmN of 23S rRNA A2503 and tRNA A37
MDELDLDGKEIDRKLWGTDWRHNNRRFEIVFKPCTPVQKNSDNQDSTDLCLVDDINDDVELQHKLNSIIDDLKTPVMNLYANQQVVDISKYGDKTIKNVSKFFTSTFNPGVPSWTDVF